MFTTILQYELKYWLKQPSTYLYAIVVFCLGFVTMSGMAGESSERFNGRFLNSTMFMYGILSRYMLCLYLLTPIIIGQSVQRDFSANVHPILYSYPISKGAYLIGKFFSSFLILTSIAGLLVFSFYLGFQMPWVNPDLLKPFEFIAYGQLFGLFLLPNLCLISVLVFGMVLWSRNIYTGFVVVLLFLLGNISLSFLLPSEANQFLAAILDPIGTKAISRYSENWTVAEQNERLLPTGNAVLYNRIFILSLTGLISAFFYKKIHLQQTAATIFKSMTNVLPQLKATTDNPKKKTILSKFGQIIKVNLPKVNFDFSFIQQLKTTWQLSNYDFRFILTSRLFISLLIGGIILVLLRMSSVDPRFETETLPMTWKLLELPSQFYAGIINLITFLFAGYLVQRSRMANMHQLVDVSPFPNWVLLLSKFLALVKVQMVLLFVVMLGGIISQIYKGYYNFEMHQYVFNLYGLNLIHFVIYAMLALFVHSFLDRPYLAFFLLLLLPVGFIGLAELGPQYLGVDVLAQWPFRYNQSPSGVFGLRYSDMDGYGPHLPSYFLSKLYWFLAGVLLIIIALLFWKRGITYTFTERWTFAKQRFNKQLAITFFTTFLGFLSMGCLFYYEGNIVQDFFTNNDRKIQLELAEKRYEKYEHFPQPKIIAVRVEVDIFPKERQFKGSGQYWLKNKTKKPIDTLIINYLPDLHTTYDFSFESEIISKDTIADLGHFDIIKLANSLPVGDSLLMTFENYNDPITWLRTNEYIKENGTFLKDDIFPRLGNWLSFMRSSNHMGEHHQHVHPTDSLAIIGSYSAKDADHLTFEAIVSTEVDQIALAPGALQKEWQENGRRYFHYKMQEKIAASYLFTSGKYEVVRDKWEDIDLEIYYDKKHPYNIDRMMAGMKASLAYCSENFSPYQYQQVRLVEFSQTGGASAHGFPGFIPAGEGAGFIANIDMSGESGVDFAFGTAVHEVAHQWWGHQVAPANVLGAKLVIESLAEYTNAMVKKKEKGMEEMRRFMKGRLKHYFEGRARDRQPERPLMYAARNQNYIHYAKGTMVLCALSDYLGEQQMNNAIKKYVEKVAFQEETYTTSIELVDYLRAATPDSLQYVIKDFFETITLYDNQVLDWSATKLANEKYKIDMDFLVRKYRAGEQGVEIYSDNKVDSLMHEIDKGKLVYSLPLADYLDIGMFRADGTELYLQKHKISTIHNQRSIIVDELPVEVGIDPYLKLIDRAMKDNRKSLRKKLL